MDSINSQVSAGTYFTRVKFYNGGADSSLDYDLDLSATNIRTPSNVLAVEEDLDVLSGTATRDGWIDNTNTTDTYEFEVESGYSVDISLSELTNDADLRLIQDRNNNNIVELDEIISSSTRGGSFNESILSINSPGIYQVQVYQYSGDTSYQIDFESYFAV